MPTEEQMNELNQMQSDAIGKMIEREKAFHVPHYNEETNLALSNRLIKLQESVDELKRKVDFIFGDFVLFEGGLFRRVKL